MVVPNPYVPSRQLLDLKARQDNRLVVGFVGRLEHRKGVTDLVDAIPRILNAEPDTHFRFIGRVLSHPGTLEPFDAFVGRKLRRSQDKVRIVGASSLDEMPREYSLLDICVFPSIWENFPNVCLEAMAAGRAIVASQAGGMAEMLEGGAHGILIPPREPKAIAEGVVRLLRSPDLRHSMGARARQRVLTAYNGETVGPQLERSLETAIALSQTNRT